MGSFVTASVWATLHTSSAEMLQAFEVALDQSFFFTTAPPLDLPLALERLEFGLILFGINEINRAVFEGV